MGEVDWSALREQAESIRERAYAGYSGYQVGAAALTEDGRVLTGCNVENASYGLTLCAECGVVSALHASGGGRLVALACVGGQQGRPAQPVLPCGRCRQLLAEHGGPQMWVDAPEGPVRLDYLLPDAFSETELNR